MKNELQRSLMEVVTYEQECLRGIVDEIVALCESGNPSDGFNKNLEGLNQTVELLTSYVRSICAGRDEETDIDLPTLFQNAKDYYRTKQRAKKLNVMMTYRWTHLLPEGADFKAMTHEERLPYVNQALEVFRFQASGQLGFLPFLALDNAIKYAPGNSTVNVVFDAENRQVVVSNYGPWISDADFVHLFEMGFRGENAVDKAPDEGMGLGLYFLNSIMERNNCRLRMEKDDTDEFKGIVGYSRFTLVADFNGVKFDGSEDFADGGVKFSGVLADIFLHEYNNMIVGLNARVDNLGIQIKNASCGVSEVEGLSDAYERLRFAYFRFLIQLSLFAYNFNKEFLQVSTQDYEIDVKQEFCRAFEYYRRRIGQDTLNIDVQLMGERNILGRVKPRSYDLFDEKFPEQRIMAKNVIREMPLLMFDFIRINSAERPEIELTLTPQRIKGASTLAIDCVFSCRNGVADLYAGYYDANCQGKGDLDSVGNLILDLLKFYIEKNSSEISLQKIDDWTLCFHIVL